MLADSEVVIIIIVVIVITRLNVQCRRQ